MAERVARVLAPPLDLVILEPPSELLLTGFTLSMLWHERTQTDPAPRWLREVIGVAGESNRGKSGILGRKPPAFQRSDGDVFGPSRLVLEPLHLSIVPGQI